MVKILAGSSCPHLAKSISDNLQCPFLVASVSRFSSQETKVLIHEDIVNEDIIIVQSTEIPINDNLIELLLLIDAAKHAKAKSILVVIPYFSYSRQDKIHEQGEPLSFNLIANLLKEAGANLCITFDIHNPNTKPFHDEIFQNIDSFPIFLPFIESFSNTVLVSPDHGSKDRAERYAKKLSIPLIIMKKSRAPFFCELPSDISINSNNHYIIIDDIVDTGKTLITAAQLLRDKGAKQISVCVTHSVLSKESKENIEKSNFSHFITTDSIVHAYLPANTIVYSCAKAIASFLSQYLKK